LILQTLVKDAIKLVLTLGSSNSKDGICIKKYQNRRTFFQPHDKFFRSPQYFVSDHFLFMAIAVFTDKAEKNCPPMHLGKIHAMAFDINPVFKECFSSD
jgi:hypothetical protein